MDIFWRARGSSERRHQLSPAGMIPVSFQALIALRRNGSNLSFWHLATSLHRAREQPASSLHAGRKGERENESRGERERESEHKCRKIKKLCEKELLEREEQSRRAEEQKSRERVGVSAKPMPAALEALMRLSIPKLGPMWLAG